MPSPLLPSEVSARRPRSVVQERGLPTHRPSGALTVGFEPPELRVTHVCCSQAPSWDFVVARGASHTSVVDLLEDRAPRGRKTVRSNLGVSRHSPWAQHTRLDSVSSGQNSRCSRTPSGCLRVSQSPTRKAGHVSPPALRVPSLCAKDFGMLIVAMLQ